MLACGAVCRRMNDAPSSAAMPAPDVLADPAPQEPATAEPSAG